MYAVNNAEQEMAL